MTPSHQTKPRFTDRWAWMVGSALIAAVGISAVVDSRQDPPSQPPGDVELVFLRAADACRGLSGIQYAFEYDGTGSFEPETARVVGTAWLKRHTDRSDAFFHVRTEVFSPASLGIDQQRYVEVSRADEEAYAIDVVRWRFLHGEADVFADRLWNQVDLVLIESMVSAYPFKPELEADSLWLEDSVTRDDVLCDVVRVHYPDDRVARWYIGRADHLPRGVDLLARLDHETASPMHEGATHLRITGLRTDVELDAFDFRLEAPQGYEIAPLDAAPSPTGSDQ